MFHSQRRFRLLLQSLQHHHAGLCWPLPAEHQGTGHDQSSRPFHVPLHVRHRPSHQHHVCPPISNGRLQSRLPLGRPARVHCHRPPSQTPAQLIHLLGLSLPRRRHSSL